MGKAKDALKIVVGRLAEFALPGLGREIDEGRETRRAPRLKRAILYARLRRAHARGDSAAVDQALAAYWKGGQGDKFHDHNAEMRFQVFRDTHAVAIAKLAELIQESGKAFTRLVEIGCGDGQVLADCVRRLPSITRAVGLDLNGPVIARAASDHAAEPRLSFVNAEARTWLTDHPQPGTVILTNGGVLEYFSPENLDALFQAVALAPPAMMVLVEPAAPEHDLKSQDESFIFGKEYSFSHNYRRRLDHAGFDVVFEEETRALGARLMMMVAVLRPSAG